MFTVLLQMGLLIGCGSFWKSHAPAHIPAYAHRRALTDLVFYILLPALVLNVIWQTPLNGSSIKISFLALCGITTGLIVMWQVIKRLDVSNPQAGALLLAAAFPNSTYLGLPILDRVLGPQTHSTVLQYDLFACTPILLTVGMMIARHFGEPNAAVHPLRQLIKIPPLWAVIVGISLNLSGVKQPEILGAALTVLAGGVVPLMLIVLGMSIRWNSLRLAFMRLLLPVAVITLIVVPILVFAMSYIIGLNDDLIVSVTLIAAMPTMVFGIVICERYQLDSELYAAAVTLTTLCSLLTLPLWFRILA